MYTGLDTIISLLRGILDNIDNGGGSFPVELIQLLINTSINDLKGGAEIDTTIKQLEESIQELTYGLYNDNSEEGALGDIVKLNQAIEEIRLFKFPNATIKGDLTVEHGQVSGFTQSSYMILPFQFDATGKRFEFNLAFITGEDVTTALNILGSAYCMALYIQDSALNIRVSNNGTSWDVWSSVIEGFTVMPNHPVYVKIAYNGLNYSVLLSKNGKNYSVAINLGATKYPHPGLLYLGVGNNFNNPFKGTINLNKCNLLFNGEHYWEGMDDAGLSTRLATDLSNIDKEGESQIKHIVGRYVITEDMFDLEADDTKGVAPYSTSVGYTNITITDPSIKWEEGSAYYFVLRTKVATSSYANVRIRLGEEGSWIPLMSNGGTIASGTSFFVKGSSVEFIYKTTYNSNGALHVSYYDTNTTYTINYSIDGGRHRAGLGAYAVARYSLLLQKPDGTWERPTNTASNYSTDTSKKVNNSGFILGLIRYYDYTNTYANNALIDANYVKNKSSSCTGSYSFNCGTAPGWKVGDYIYLVGTVKTDGLFYLDDAKWWDNKLPTSNDGKIYIRLGIALASTDSTFSLLEDRPVFYHDGTQIRLSSGSNEWYGTQEEFDNLLVYQEGTTYYIYEDDVPVVTNYLIDDMAVYSPEDFNDGIASFETFDTPLDEDILTEETNNTETDA